MGRLDILLNEMLSGDEKGKKKKSSVFADRDILKINAVSYVFIKCLLYASYQARLWGNRMSKTQMSPTLDRLFGHKWSKTNINWLEQKLR